MSKFGSSADTFGTFLRTVRRKRSKAAGSDNGSLRILKILEAGPMPVPDLMKQSGMPADAFVNAFGAMRKAALIDLSGDGAHEFAILTEAGEQMANLAAGR